MATGIVSIAILLDGSETLSRALLVVAAGGWCVGSLLLLRGLADRSWRRRAAASISSLTAVAGTAVLGTRLTLLGWDWAGWALLALATALCLVLLAALASARPRPRSGTTFLVVVAPQSVAVLASSLAARLALSWPAFVAAVPLAYGLRDYARTLTRFDLGELRVAAGDHWIAGGAIAISTLACAELAQATGVVGAPAGIHDPLRVAALVLWALTMAWLPVLVAAETLWRRRRYDVRRWATVFPLGMYSVMSFAVGAVDGSGWIVDFARAWAWVALAVWIAVAAGAARVAANHIVLRYRES